MTLYDWAEINADLLDELQRNREQSQEELRATSLD